MECILGTFGICLCSTGCIYQRRVNVRKQYANRNKSYLRHISTSDVLSKEKIKFPKRELYVLTKKKPGLCCFLFIV